MQANVSIVHILDTAHHQDGLSFLFRAIATLGSCVHRAPEYAVITNSGRKHLTNLALDIRKNCISIFRSGPKINQKRLRILLNKLI